MSDPSSHVLVPPTLRPDGLEVAVCACPRLLLRELAGVFPRVPLDGLLAVVTCQHAALDLVRFDPAVDAEKDLLLERVRPGARRATPQVVAWARSVVERATAEGFWADLIDPCSGLPVRRTTRAHAAALQRRARLALFRGGRH